MYIWYVIALIRQYLCTMKFNYKLLSKLGIVTNLHRLDFHFLQHLLSSQNHHHHEPASAKDVNMKLINYIGHTHIQLKAFYKRIRQIFLGLLMKGGIHKNS